MSLSLFEAVEEIREKAMDYRLPGEKRKFLWATMVSQFAKSDSCDGSLANLLLDIIKDYLKKPSDQDIISMWLQTETGGGDDPEELFPDCVRIELQMELLDEVTRVAWQEGTDKRSGKKKRKR